MDKCHVFFNVQTLGVVFAWIVIFKCSCNHPPKTIPRECYPALACLFIRVLVLNISDRVVRFSNRCKNLFVKATIARLWRLHESLCHGCIFLFLFNSTPLLSQSQFFLNFYLFQNFFINDRLLTNLGHLFIIQRFFLV